MERIPRGLYTPEFRLEAVKLVKETGMSIAQAAKQLSVPKSSLHKWVALARAGNLSTVGQGQGIPSELEVG